MGFHPKLFCVISICLGFSLIQSSYATGVDKNAAGAVVSVKNTAYRISVNSRGRKIPLKSGDSIFAEDEIVTEGNSAVKILLGDQSVIDLGAATSFRVAEYRLNEISNREVVLDLSQGVLRGAVTQKISSSGNFKLRTKSASMGVRGTEFVVQNDQSSAKGSALFTVIQGAVEVTQNLARHSSGQPVTLGAGQQIVAPVGSTMPAAVVTLDKATFSKVESSSRVSDNTFSKAITIEVKSDNSRTPASSSSQGPAETSRNSTLSEIASVVAIQVGVAAGTINTAQMGISGTPALAAVTGPVTALAVNNKQNSGLNVMIRH